MTSIPMYRASNLIAPTPRDFAHSDIALRERRDRVLGYVHARNMASPYPWHLRAATWLKTHRKQMRHVVVGIAIALVTMILVGVAVWAHGYVTGVSETKVAMSGPKGKR